MFSRPRIIPVLLIDNRDLVKTIQFGKRTYLGDPVNAVKIFNRKRVDELVVLDISASSKGFEPDFDLLHDIASEAFMPLSYGGGLRTVEQIREVLSIGYEKAIINTALVESPKLVEEASAIFGSQSIVASIDAKGRAGNRRCAIRDGLTITDITPDELARDAEQLGAGEIIINSVDRDGMMGGYDIELIKSVSSAVGIPVVALGGAGGVSDLKRALVEGGAHAAAGGSMFVYYGRLKAVLITAPSELELTQVGIYSS